MRIRGRRECTDCGREWSYYETGAVTCPDCGSPFSVGRDERTQHTDAAVELDLAAERAAVEEEPLGDVLAAAAETCREYRRRSGFIRAGALREPTAVDLVASEIVHLAGAVRGRDGFEPATAEYALSLLAVPGEGSRPPPERVPADVRESRALGVADVVAEYVAAARRWDGADPADRVAALLERVEDHRRRVQAIGGDLPPASAEALLEALRDCHATMTGADDAAVARGHERLERLE